MRPDFRVRRDDRPIAGRAERCQPDPAGAIACADGHRGNGHAGAVRRNGRRERRARRGRTKRVRRRRDGKWALILHRAAGSGNIRGSHGDAGNAYSPARAGRRDRRDAASRAAGRGRAANAAPRRRACAAAGQQTGRRRAGSQRDCSGAAERAEKPVRRDSRRASASAAVGRKSGASRAAAGWRDLFRASRFEPTARRRGTPRAAIRRERLSSVHHGSRLGGERRLVSGARRQFREARSSRRIQERVGAHVVWHD